MLGARRHYAVPRLLHESGLLERFYTDSYIGNKRWLEATLQAIPPAKRPAIVERWLGRKDQILPQEKVTSFDLFGLWYVWAQRQASKCGAIEDVFIEGASRFAQRIEKHGLRGSSVVWGFNGASLELFRYAKQQGIQCVLDQTSNPTPIEQRLTDEEHEKWGNWLGPGVRSKSKSFLHDRESEEWVLADAIVAGSEFVKDGLIQYGTSQNKIYVIPTGIDLTRFAIREKPPFDGKRPLRVLFVGRVSVMKGIPYLLQALTSLGSDRVEARLIGGISINHNVLEQFHEVATASGAVPRSLMAEQYQWADVFCFPSITEGSAAVTYEAIASGLPVITTPNAGSIVRDGLDGFIVPIRDANGLARAMSEYIEHPDLLGCHQQSVRGLRKDAGLERYQADLENLVRGLNFVG